jgi:hypothetical protein
MVNYGKRELYVHDGLIAVGDIHGEYENLESIISQIEPLIKEKTHVVFCGDIINRGKNSIKCLIGLNEFSKKYPGQIYFILGNHEQMLLDYLKIDVFKDNHKFTDYMAVYGNDTLEEAEELFDISINTDSVTKALKNSGVTDFLMSFIPYYESKSVLITHSPLDVNICSMHGLIKDLKSGNKTPQSFYLEKIGEAIRWEFADESVEGSAFKKYRICGHQPSDTHKPRIYNNRAFIDTACGLKSQGPLTALLYPSKKYLQSVK